MDPTTLTQLRAETPTCQNLIFLNNAGSSLMPATVIGAVREHLDLELQVGGYEAKEIKQKAILAFYEHAAQLLNCAARNIAFCSSATDAYARALSSIPFQRDDIILTTEEDYISNQIAFLAYQRRFGIRILRAPALEQGGVDLDGLAKMIKRNKPKLVAVTHVPTSSGLVQNVSAVGAICRDHDCLYLIDGCQSAGQMPLDVAKLQCDFLSATGRKFLRGPRGTGFLFISDRVLDMQLEPLTLDMEGANWTAPDSYSLFPDARRFEEWEKPYANLLGLSAAFEYALNIGLATINKRVTALAALLRQGLQHVAGMRVLDRGNKLCAIVTATKDTIEPINLLRALRREKVHAGISRREYAVIDFGKKKADWALRMAPHYFNTEDEINRAVETVKNLLMTGR